VGLPLALVVGYRGKGVLRAMPDAVLAEARVGPFLDGQLDRGSIPRREHRHDGEDLPR